MSWKQSLDKYLITPPEDGFTEWCEQVDDNLSNEFYEEYGDWIVDSDTSTNWYNKLFNNSVDPKEAAKIIERAVNIYKIKPN